MSRLLLGARPGLRLFGSPKTNLFSHKSFYIHHFTMDANQNNHPAKKTYHKKATGKALETAEKHSQHHELKLFGSCFW